ncbi:lysophospholipid acyltransferase family protein [Testudinibacter sp. TR-2022]|uniref:lysophospholipid acyltransferase family protein n=1 Tax=Testudinibacter sp. TR-2022 TaxID=2585029 RepID=UPI00111A94D4|nr:lysophospholipid acyltransferase family protein [Testudinibacter sp. TR-2022]TNH06457.1 1-acyl-sn-glycerol-3-phosphate acyltransferase [Pasteurellaceae bacterium Phil11]TNH24806.1 1-acyl-sn-glycerol-3-phosphate acyltransferase [Testudinibacter sp. TR-2022]TNH29239.1 1-acyl-sn-glycerol-3-phosphate acyltransferase [Testudinibacter sp. TR-2022]
MIASLLAALTKLLIGAYPHWRNNLPSGQQRIYFANHTSHLDTLAIWSSFNAEFRAKIRPVAAKDYWDKGGLRGLIAKKALNVVMIDREGNSDDPLQPLYTALDQGDSLILFPEGTRSAESQLAAFKSGLYHLRQRYPQVELVPIYLDNTGRSLPKGAFLPLPFTCSVTFGEPLQVDAKWDKAEFLHQARQAVIALSQPLPQPLPQSAK